MESEATGFGPGGLNLGALGAMLALYWFLIVAGGAPLVYILAWAASRGWRDGRKQGQPSP